VPVKPKNRGHLLICHQSGPSIAAMDRLKASYSGLEKLKPGRVQNQKIGEAQGMIPQGRCGLLIWPQRISCHSYFVTKPAMEVLCWSVRCSFGLV
jgi:hypothetical protein